MHRLLHLLTVILLSTARADDGRTLRILFLAAPEQAPEVLHLFDGTGSRRVELPRLNLSPVYKIPAATGVLRLLSGEPLSPEAIDPGAPKVIVPEALTDFYLLVSSDPSNPVVPVKMQLVDASADKFRDGQMLWFNLTPNRIGGQIGGTRLDLGANSRLITGPPSARNEDYPVNLAFRMPDNERLYPLCETKWLHDPRSRTLLFVLPQQGNRTPRVLEIPDCREPSAVTQAP